MSKPAIVTVILIAALGFVAYANSLKGEFLWDDEHLVKKNPYIKDWSHLGEIFTRSIRTGAEETTNFYRPLQTFTYLVDYSLWKLNVIGYHLTNAFLHILVALTVSWLVLILFKDRNLSLLTGLFFVTHPVHTEAVSYIAGRADILTALFMLISLIFYVRNMEMPLGSRTVIIGVSYVLALLSRENSLIFPFMLLVYHYALRKPVPKRDFSIAVLITVAYILWRWALLRDIMPQESSETTFFQRLPGFFVAIASYLRLLIAPYNLHMAYGGLLFSFKDPMTAWGILLTSLILIYSFKKRLKDRLTFFSVSFFFVALLPSSNIYPLNAYMAEHWLYLPSIGFFLVLSRLLLLLKRNKKTSLLTPILSVSLLTLCCAATVRQNRYWREPISFYSRMLKYAPYSSKLYNNLAKAYQEMGEKDELIDLLQRAIEIEPDNAVAYNNLGNAYGNTRRYEDAAKSYRKAIEIDPDYATPYYNLGLIYADVKKNEEEALKLLNKAIEISPYYVEAYHKIALMNLARGKTDEAIDLIKKAIKIDPDRAEMYKSLGYIYFQCDRINDAKDMYRKALEVNPSYAEAYHDLSIVYLTEQQYELAIECYQKAVKLGYDDKSLLEALKPHMK